MRVGLTGATGLIGRHLVGALRERRDEVRVFSRDPARARARLGAGDAVQWDPAMGPAPAEALSGLDAVVNLAGERIDQRWTAAAKSRISQSRVLGTRNLVAGMERAEQPPPVLVSASAAGYYGDRGDELLREDAEPGSDFLARVCIEWERAADGAAALGARVVKVRTGVVLDRSGGALPRMALPFRVGLGGPIGSGRQYLPWVALEDVIAIYLAAIDGAGPVSTGPPERRGWSGPVNACAPHAVTNREFSGTLARVLHRPALVPLPAIALRAIFGELATALTSGQRMVPARALDWGYEFRYPELEGALTAILGGR